MTHTASDAHVGKHYSVSECHATTQRIKSLDYFTRDYTNQSTSIMSNYNLLLNYYQGAHLINFNFNKFTLRCSLSDDYIWGYRLLTNAQQLLHLHTARNNDDAVERATGCNLNKTTQHYGHFLLTTRHGS